MSNNGTLLKITPAKKLMIKIDQATFERFNNTMQQMASKHKHTDSRLATWEFTDNDGEPQYRITVKLDKYDIQNLRKFEALIGSKVGFSGSFKPYAFTPEGEAEICGINYQLSSIYKRKEPVEKD
jgi:hypothetical protein